MKPVWYLISIIGLSIALSIYSTILAINEVQAGEPLSSLWVLVFALLVALWAREDAGEKQIYRPLDFPAYFFLAWPLALPYYLARTRGIEGLILFCGFVVLHFSPFLSGLVAYLFFYPEQMP